MHRNTDGSGETPNCIQPGDTAILIGDLGYLDSSNLSVTICLQAGEPLLKMMANSDPQSGALLPVYWVTVDTDDITAVSGVSFEVFESICPKAFQILAEFPESNLYQYLHPTPDSAETGGDNARADDGIEIGDILNSGAGEATTSTNTGGDPFDGIGFSTEQSGAATGFFYDEESYGEHSRPPYGPHGIFAGTPHGDPLLMVAGMVEAMLLQRKLEDLARAALTSSPISAMLDATTIATASARRGYVMIVIKNVGDDSTEAPQSNPASATDQSTTSRRSPRWPWNR